MFKGVKRVLCVGIDKRCSYAFLLILYGFLLSTKMTTPEMGLVDLVALNAGAQKQRQKSGKQAFFI